MSQIRNRSPGRIRGPQRRAIQSSVIAPRMPLTDSYRKSGWKPVVSGGYIVHGYCGTRWAQSMVMPHGRSVGGPYSSWLKKLPQRPMACITKMPGRDDVCPLPERLVPEAQDHRRRDDPGQDPAVDAEARVGRHHDREKVVLVPLPLVDDVVQAAADEGRDRHDDDPVVHQPGIQAPAARLAGDDQVRRGQSKGVADAVPVDRDGADLEGDGIRRHVDQRDQRQQERGHQEGHRHGV